MPLDIGTIHPLRPGGTPEGDPFAGLPEWAPPKAAEAAPAGDPFAALPSWSPPRPATAKEGGRDIGPAESAGIGAREGLTFGAFPAMHGAIAAGQSEEERKASEKAYASGEPPSAISELGSLFKGLLRLGLTEKEARRVYSEERDVARKEQESASEQNPGSYLAGQLGAAVATPVAGGAGAATAAGRFLGAARGGGVAGGLYGGGEALSKGEEPIDIAKDVGLGGITGAGLGTAGHGVLEAAGKGARYGSRIIQGAWNPEALAARDVGRLTADTARKGRLGLNQEEMAGALSDQTPVHNIDIGGDPTRRLGRAVSNISSQAAETLAAPIEERQLGRYKRIADKVNGLFGGRLDSGSDTQRLRDAARLANGPAYKRAYASGERPIGTDPEMQRLMGSPTVKEAMTKAITTGKDRAIRERAGAFNPGVHVTPDGRLVFDKGRGGVPTYPNIQYWDYVQREMRDMAEKQRIKNPSKASLIEGLRGDLNKILDADVPEFGAARAGAAKFFGAEDALEAGQKFVTRNADVREARRALAAMSRPERELFARGFADQLSQHLLNNQSWGTVKRAFTDGRAREKIEMALGPARTRELEVATRVEMMAKKTEDVLFGNSTTARQLSDVARFAKTGLLSSGGHAIGGAGAIGAYELLKEGDYSPKDMLMGAFAFGALRGGAHRIDMKVAESVAKLLASEDPALLRRGAQAVARSPVLFDALRRGTEAGARVTAHKLGPSGVSAATLTMLENVLKDEDHGHHGHDNIDLLQDQSTQ